MTVSEKILLKLLTHPSSVVQEAAKHGLDRMLEKPKDNKVYSNNLMRQYGRKH